MKIKIIDNGREREVELSEESTHALKKAFTEEKKGLWKTEAGEDCWCLYTDGDLSKDEWQGDIWHMSAHEQGNIFPTREAAKKESEKRKAIQRVKEYIAREFGVFEPDWNDENQGKYFPYYGHRDGRRDPRFGWHYVVILQYYSPFGYLSTVKDCKQLIKDCEDDLKIIYEIE